MSLAGGDWTFVNVREALAVDAAHRPPEDVDPEAAERAGAELGAGDVALLREAAPDNQVGPVAPGRLEDAGQLGGRVLAVGVEMGEVGEAVVSGVPIAGLQSGPEADVEGEDRHFHAGDAGDLNRVIP
jgi:hypothetical protein